MRAAAIAALLIVENFIIKLISAAKVILKNRKTAINILNLLISWSIFRIFMLDERFVAYCVFNFAVWIEHYMR